MGINIEKNALRAMIAEILLEDKEFLKNVLHTVFKENPNLLAELTGASPHVGEPSTEYKKAEKATVETAENDPNFPVLADLTLERKKWLEERIAKDFIKYDDVFKALA